MLQKSISHLTIPPYLRKTAAVLSVLFCIAALGYAVLTLTGGGANQQPYVFYKVTTTDLPFVVTERGSLESQVETTITCEVENVTADRSGNVGTQIIYIVPNGSAVKKDDLLVEFDSATIRDRLDTQMLAYQKAISAKTQAVARYNNQLIQNETAVSEATLDVELAKISHEMYIDPSDGTFQLAIEEIERQVDDAKNTTLESRAALELAKVDRAGVKELFKLGYRGKSDLEQARLKYLQAEDKLASSVNRMKTYQANRRKLTRFERLMEEKRLQGAVDTAERTLKQVMNDNESVAEQALAAKEEAENTEAKEKERLDRIENQLANCLIYAPHDGMVVYARDRRGTVEIYEGAIVRERQEILTLPDLSKMEVKTQVHEAVLDQVRPGLPATVRVDAFPDHVYRGVVDKVGVVPSSNGGFFGSGSVKTYETVVRLVDEVENLKPGMTAVVNMHVDKVKNVLAVPVQAVVQANQATWCYVQAGDSVQRRDIKIGRSNDKFVHVQDGLVDGDRVVLNSMDIFQEHDRETNEISPESGVPEMPESLVGIGYDAPQQAPAARQHPGQPPGEGGGATRPDGPGEFGAARPGGPGGGEGRARGGGPADFRQGQPGSGGGPPNMQAGPRPGRGSGEAGAAGGRGPGQAGPAGGGRPRGGPPGGDSARAPGRPSPP